MVNYFGILSRILIPVFYNQNKLHKNDNFKQNYLDQRMDSIDVITITRLNDFHN